MTGAIPSSADRHPLGDLPDRPGGQASSRPLASIVIPAHDEESVIGRLLGALIETAEPDEFEIVVACNGCRDKTATVAGSYAPAVRVVETPTASKIEALRLGDATASSFPRLYVDADVELPASGVRSVVAALDAPGVHAAAPERTLLLDGASWPVRAYYAVWERLPAVRAGIFGRGVIALDEEGHRRLGGWPDVVGDDLFVHSLFTDAERRVVSGPPVVVRGARRLPDLVRRRVRTAMGNLQHSAQHTAGASAAIAPPPTGLRTLWAVGRQTPSLLPRIPVFVAITAWARLRARRELCRSRTSGRPTVWLRDESSR